MPTPKKKKVTVKITTRKKAKQVPNAFVVSQYFGFNEVKLPEIAKEDLECAQKIKKGSEYEDENLPETTENLALLKQYKDQNFEEAVDPIMLYCEGCSKGATQKPKRGEKRYSFHIIGTPHSIAEALLIKAALCILNEEGYKDTTVEINNVGGKDSLPTFVRELTAYYRKHVNDMDTECRQLFKDGPHALVACGTTINEAVKAQAPSPLNYLSDSNRTHFKEVVEFLESHNIPYDINKDILGNPNYSTNTVFTILDKKTGKILATGSRYNQLARKAGYRKDIPSVGMTIRLAKSKQVPASRLPKPEKTKFYFIQLSQDAKIKSLEIIDMLRQANIPVFQAIARNKLSTQLAKARKMKVPYVLIMGQQEANNNTVVIRDMETHSQITVPINKLIDHLKNL